MSGGDCQIVRADLFDRTLDRLEPDRRVEEHLARCPACARLAQKLDSMIRVERAARAEELSPAAEQRAWRAMADGPRWRRGFTLGWPAIAAPWRWLAVGATAALVVGVLARTLHRPIEQRAAPPTARLVWQEGEVAVKRAAALEGGAALGAGDRVETGAAAQAGIALPGAEVVALDETSLALEALGGDRSRLALSRGKLRVEVKPAEKRAERLQVRLPRLLVTVIGTRFEVESTPERDEVSVQRGRVRVTLADGSSQEVGAGEALAVGEAGIERQAPRQVVPAAEDEEASVARPARRAPRGRQRELREIEELAGSRRCAAAERAGRRLGALADDLQAQAWVLAGDCFMAEGDRAAALGLYDRAGRRFAHTPAGRNALYETGRLALESGERDRARRAFTRFLEQSPRGPLAAEALYRVCVLEADDGRTDEALFYLTKYRVNHPRGRRSGDAACLELRLLASRRDCRGAADAYARCREHGRPEAEAARPWVERCPAEAR